MPFPFGVRLDKNYSIMSAQFMVGPVLCHGLPEGPVNVQFSASTPSASEKEGIVSHPAGRPKWALFDLMDYKFCDWLLQLGRSLAQIPCSCRRSGVTFQNQYPESLKFYFRSSMFCGFCSYCSIFTAWAEPF